MNLQQIDAKICENAARIANLMVVRDPRIPPQYIHMFVPQSNKLGLTFDESYYALGDEIVKALQEIGKEALTKALLEDPTLLVKRTFAVNKIEVHG